MRICKIPGCNNKHLSGGYCSKHYARYNKYGDPNYSKYDRNHSMFCAVRGCENQYYCKGYCEKHYSKFKKYGNPQHIEKEQHGMDATPEYWAWSSMKKRCYNSNNSNYCHYGGRGIVVCDKWRNSFMAFIEDMGLKPFPKAQIDRIDNDGNYEPDNCMWATSTENNRHTSKTKLDINKAEEIRQLYKTGKILQREIAVMYGIKRATVSAVMRKKIWKT